MSKEIDIYYQKLYKKYKKKYLSLKNQNAGANNIYFIIKLDNFEIFSNNDSTFILKNNNIYASGKHQFGQLGLGDITRMNNKIFTKVSSFPYVKVVKQVVAGRNHTMILVEDGTVFACGSNDAGQLGLGDDDNKNTFTAVRPLPDGKIAKQVVAGFAHTIIIAKDNTVFGCGSNENGQLGLGDIMNTKTFTELALQVGNVATQVTANSFYTMVLVDGVVFACGWNNFGELGLGVHGYNNNKKTFTAVTSLPEGTVAKQVVAGLNHTMILAEDGTVFTCGRNYYGQLGLGNNDDRNTFTAVSPLPDGKVTKQVAAGYNHTMILAEDGTVFTCGKNEDGQLGLGLGFLDNQNTFTAVPPLPKGKVAKQVFAGYEHTIIIAEDNTVFGSGRNDDGQLGNLLNLTNKFTEIDLNYLN